MSTRYKKTDVSTVDEIVRDLDEERFRTVEVLRRVILSTHEQIGEQIKWNSPAYFYKGIMKPFDPREYRRDILVMNFSKEFVMLVFPTGSKIEDSSGILEGKFADTRKIVKIQNEKDAKLKASSLQAIIRNWMQQIE